MPWKWKNGKEQTQLSEALDRWFSGDCSLFYSGRESLLALLKACNFPEGSEVIIQGYTCVALPNAISAAGYIPVFVDADMQTLNMNVDAVKNAMTTNTKAIICQHTFGIPADTKRLRSIADAHKALLIEDCAHCIPDVTGPKVIGKYADAIMLSFGRDKAISGVTGGAVITKNAKLTNNMQKQRALQKHKGMLHIKTLLLYPSLYFVARPLYSILIGKALLHISAKLRILIPVLTTKEKEGTQNQALHSMPNACCGLALWQLKKLHSLNNHRRTLVMFYLQQAKEYGWDIPSDVNEHLPLQKFPLYVENADVIRQSLKAKHIYLDDGWTGASLCPRGVNAAKAGYKKGTCKEAERIGFEILTLPTHMVTTKVQAEKLVSTLKALLG